MTTGHSQLISADGHLPVYVMGCKNLIYVIPYILYWVAKIQYNSLHFPHRKLNWINNVMEIGYKCCYKRKCQHQDVDLTLTIRHVFLNWEITDHQWVCPPSNVQVQVQGRGSTHRWLNSTSAFSYFLIIQRVRPGILYLHVDMTSALCITYWRDKMYFLQWTTKNDLLIWVVSSCFSLWKYCNALTFVSVVVSQSISGPECFYDSGLIVQDWCCLLCSQS